MKGQREGGGIRLILTDGILQSMKICIIAVQQFGRQIIGMKIIIEIVQHRIIAFAGKIGTEQGIGKGLFKQSLSLPGKSAHAQNGCLALQGHGSRAVIAQFAGQGIRLPAGRQSLVAVTAELHSAEPVPPFQRLLTRTGMQGLFLYHSGFFPEHLLVVMPPRHTRIEHPEQRVQILSMCHTAARKHRHDKEQPDDCPT